MSYEISKGEQFFTNLIGNKMREDKEFINRVLARLIKSHEDDKEDKNKEIK